MNPLFQMGAGMALPQWLGGGLIAQGIGNAVSGWSGGDMLTQGFKDAVGQPLARLTNTKANMMNEIATNLNKMAEKRTMEKVSSADLKFIDDLISGMSSFETEKTAASTAQAGGLLKGMLNNSITQNAMPIMSALALGTIGLSAGSAVYDKIRDAVKQHMSYKAMFDEFPELNEMPRTQVDKYWGVLNDFAPKLTTNPLVAGQFISNMASYGMRGIDHNIVGQLAKIQGDLRNSTGLNTSLGVLSNIAKSGYDNVFDAMTDIPDTAAATASLNNTVTP
ncbi:MAG: hypothetical protein J6Y02_04810 [Pseudobutyrivibrio sp.]|nr:hypothetical protein [Pseudobutyrivibrio sp.]